MIVRRVSYLSLNQRISWKLVAQRILMLALRQRLPPLGPASSDGFARRGAAFLWGAPGRYCLPAFAGSLQPSSSSEFDCCCVFFLPSHIALISYAKRLEKRLHLNKRLDIRLA